MCSVFQMALHHFVDDTARIRYLMLLKMLQILPVVFSVDLNLYIE